MRIEEAIGRDPDRMSGALCFKDTRLPVKTLFDHLARGEWEAFQEDFGPVPPETIAAIFAEAYRLLDEDSKRRTKAA